MNLVICGKVFFVKGPSYEYMLDNGEAGARRFPCIGALCGSAMVIL